MNKEEQKEYRQKYNKKNQKQINEYNQKYREEHEEWYNNYKKTYYQANKIKQLKQQQNRRINTPESMMLTRTKARAKKYGFPFNLELVDISIPVVCPILGIKLKLDNSKIGFDSPSIDKIIPALGYVKGNIQIISYRANAMKHDSTFDEMIKLGEWAKNQINS